MSKFCIASLQIPKISNCKKDKDHHLHPHASFSRMFDLFVCFINNLPIRKAQKKGKAYQASANKTKQAYYSTKQLMYSKKYKTDYKKW